MSPNGDQKYGRPTGRLYFVQTETSMSNTTLLIIILLILLVFGGGFYGRGRWW